MRVRDRLIVAVVAAVLVIGAVWLLLVSPERKQASSLSGQIATEQSALQSAEASLASARAAAARYLADIHQLGEVTTAIPANVDEPSALTTITRLAGTKVDVHEVSVGDSATSATAMGTTTSTGPQALALTVTFNATYESLQHFLVALDRLTKTDGTSIEADGRLFTVSSVTLAPQPPKETQATVTLTAFSQGPTEAAMGATGASGATGATTTTATAAVKP